MGIFSTKPSVQTSRTTEQTDVLAQIPALAGKYESYVIEARRKVHQLAEVGGHEVKTSAFIRQEAEALGLPVESVSATGLLVTLDTDRPGNGVALRADMDALPVREHPNNMKCARSVVSNDPETCHACGHDAHVGMLLGAMRILCDLRKQLTGSIYFCFEEGEEVGTGWGGMVDALEKRSVNTAFAIHVSSVLEHGRVSVDPGPRMGGMQEIEATFVGRGGHGSRPDLSINPVYAAASAICDLTVAFVNQIDPEDPVTLGITSIQGGSAKNVFPDTATVLGSMRFFSVEAGKRAVRLTKKVFSNSADTHRCQLEFAPTMSVFLPATINDADAAAFARNVFTKTLPEGTLASTKKWYGSESFSQYTVRYKSVYAFLGIRNEELGTTAEHHNEHFDIDESALVNGLICYSSYAAAAAGDQTVSTWQRKDAPEIIYDDDADAPSEVFSVQEQTPAAASGAKYNLDTKIGVLLKSDQAKTAVDSVVSGIVTHPQINYVKGMTIRKAAKMLPKIMTPEVLEKLEQALAGVTE